MTWRDLQARFLELQREADGLCANWNPAGWNDAYEEWYLSGSQKESAAALFKAYAGIAGETVLRRAAGDPKFFFWVDILRTTEPNYEAQKVGMSTAVFFWLDLLKKDSPNFHQFQDSVTASDLELFAWLNALKPELGLSVKTRQFSGDHPRKLNVELGMIVQACLASANYCERIGSGYIPAIELPRAAQKHDDSEHRDWQTIPTGAQTKRREMSDITQAVIGRLVYQRGANVCSLVCG